MDFWENVSEDYFLFPISLTETQAKDEESWSKRFAIPTSRGKLRRGEADSTLLADESQFPKTK